MINTTKILRIILIFYTLSPQIHSSAGVKQTYKNTINKGKKFVKKNKKTLLVVTWLITLYAVYYFSSTSNELPKRKTRQEELKEFLLLSKNQFINDIILLHEQLELKNGTDIIIKSMNDMIDHQIDTEMNELSIENMYQKLENIIKNGHIPTSKPYMIFFQKARDRAIININKAKMKAIQESNKLKHSNVQYTR